MIPACRGHRALIVEDDPAVRAMLEDLVRSRGDEPCAVATVDDAIAALHRERFCYILLDQQLPTTLGAEPMLGGGERVLVAARKLDARRNASDFHVTPIIVITGYSSHEDFISKMYDLGATGFLSKPLKPNLEKLLDRIRTFLARAGRGDHEACAALAIAEKLPGEANVAPGDALVVTLAIECSVVGGRCVVRVCGEPKPMQASKFVVLLRLVVLRERGIERWAEGLDLGIGDNRAVTTAIREPFKGLVPAGFQVLERDRRGQFRLNPIIDVAPVNWDALAEHPDERVLKVALEARKRNTRA